MAPLDKVNCSILRHVRRHPEQLLVRPQVVLPAHRPGAQVPGSHLGRRQTFHQPGQQTRRRPQGRLRQLSLRRRRRRQRRRHRN